MDLVFVFVSCCCQDPSSLRNNQQFKLKVALASGYGLGFVLVVQVAKISRRKVFGTDEKVVGLSGSPLFVSQGENAVYEYGDANYREY